MISSRPRECVGTERDRLGRIVWRLAELVPVERLGRDAQADDQDGRVPGESLS